MAAAEDIYMEAIIQYWEKRKELPADTNIPGYLLTSVKNKALNHLRHLTIRTDAEDQLYDHRQRELNFRISSLESCDPSELFTIEVKEIIRKTLDELPEQTRTIFFKSRYESMTNREIAAVYKAEIVSYLLQIGAVTRTTADQIVESLYTNDVKKLQSAIAEYMDKSISFYDAGAEGFYHGLVLGLIALLDQQYKITSNREFGEGRYDISLFPRELRYPGILMELKWKKGITEDTLKKLAKEALNQIETQRYDTEMRQEGVTEVIKLGIAFSGKNVKIWTV